MNGNNGDDPLQNQPGESDSADSFEIPYSEEEMERRRQEEGGRSLSEIWKSLGRQ